MLRIRPRFDARFAIAVTAAHAATGVVAALLPINPWLTVMLWIAVGANLLSIARRHVFRNFPSAIREARVDARGDWSITRADGATETVTLTAAACYPRLVVLEFTGTGRWRRSLVLTTWSVDPSTLRKLNVRLRT